MRPQGGQVYNYKALQRLAGEPAVLNSQLYWEPFFLLVVNSLYNCYSIIMLEEIKIPIEQLREEIMNVWGRL